MRLITVAFKILVILIMTVACKSNSNTTEGRSNSEDIGVSDEGNSEDAFEDGTYCADVTYYNPKTGTRNTYTLTVDVENNELTVIHWPNGGWLDDTHFSPEQLDSEGTCSFNTYEGMQYDIDITGSECSFTDNSVITDLRRDAEDVTCPKCGDEKETYDDYCDRCQDRIEKTCNRCGEYDMLMFSTDEMCTSCKRKLEEEQQEEREQAEGQY